jgi:hypothetical protein
MLPMAQQYGWSTNCGAGAEQLLLVIDWLSLLRVVPELLNKADDGAGAEQLLMASKRVT